MSASPPVPAVPAVEPPAGVSRRDARAERLLDDLNASQRAAVTHEGSPLLVVAGAGSGKTRVLTRRVAWTITKRGAHPGSVLAITFTNKAAGEMRERVAALVGGRARLMTVSTFHSACVRILRREAGRLGFSSSFSIYDQADSRRLMTLVCRDLELDPKGFAPRAVLGWVSKHKNELVDAEQAARQASNDTERGNAAAYQRYQARLVAANALDFDDLIMTTVKLFQDFPDVREAYRRRFRHVLVDEYQDTNHAQYVLVRELCAPEPASAQNGGGDRIGPAELMVVGDSDQSIYAFRGANIRNILEFEHDFPAAETVVLEQNYRSTQSILSAANAVIAHNSGRASKRLWTDAGQGEVLVGYVADDQHAEAQFVAEEIDRLTDEGLARPGAVAVFYRTNAQSRVFEEVFIRVGLPYKVVGGVRFYERREVKDALAYLRVLVNPRDAVSLRRILNVPKRGIGQRAEACVAALAEQERIDYLAALRRCDEAPGIVTRSVSAIRAFLQIIDDLRALVDVGEPADVVLQACLSRSGYLAELEGSEDPQDETRVENLAELVAVAREFVGDAGDEAPEPDAPDPRSLDAFLERVALVADSDQIPDDDEAGDGGGVVTLMTLHTAKGLEFPVVFLTGLEEGVFPHSRSLYDTRELEEERRLAYVGITRAQQRLYVSRATVRSAWGVPNHYPASRFLADLPDSLVDWRRTEADQTRWTPRTMPGPARPAGAAAPTTFASRPGGPGGGREVPSLDAGDRVVHDTFGMGTVVVVEGVGERSVASVDFGSQGVKRLLLRYAPLERL